jgi:hypothetical protein
MEHHDYLIVVVTNFIPSFESLKFSSHPQYIVLNVHFNIVLYVVWDFPHCFLLVQSLSVHQNSNSNAVTLLYEHSTIIVINITVFHFKYYVNNICSCTTCVVFYDWVLTLLWTLQCGWCSSTCDQLFNTCTCTYTMHNYGIIASKSTAV